MMANYQIETGYQLFARLNTSYNLENIYSQLIPNNGPKRREVVEIVGETSTGKTFIVTEMIAKCLLPEITNDINIGGKNAGAIIINTDLHFNIFKLVQVMENIIESCTENKLTSAKISDIINDSLKNLIILNCFDSQQLYITIHNLENIVSNNNKLSLLILDSISAYYWTDRLNGGIRKMDLYQKCILKLLQSVTKEYNLVIVFTKYSGFQSKKEFIEECCKTPTLERINYRIFLEKYPEQNGFIAQITLPDNTIISKQYIIKDVIKWIE